VVHGEPIACGQANELVAIEHVLKGAGGEEQSRVDCA
jgi:hypothetical protein